LTTGKVHWLAKHPYNTSFYFCMYPLPKMKMIVYPSSKNEWHSDQTYEKPI
jgi:hypothetical protein